MNNKKIIFHVTWQYMKRNRGRTAVTFTGIALMVMLMTCVFVGKDTTIHYLENVAALHAGSWHLTVYGLNTASAEKVAALKDIDQIGYCARLGFTDFPSSQSEEHPYLEVKAYSPVSFTLANIHVTQGRLPESDGEIIITETALRDGASVKLGDVIDAQFFDRSLTGINADISESVFPYYNITVPYGETVETPLNFPYYPENGDFRQNKDYRGTGGAYTVVGFMETPSFENRDGAGYPALTALTDLSSVEGSFNALLTLDLDRVDHISNAFNAIKAITGDEVDINNALLVFSAKGEDSVITGITVFIEAFFVALIMAASLILIYNVFQMSFRERTKYLGMLSSVGATGRQKRFSVYYEAAVLLAAALPVGILLGIGVVKGGMFLLKPHLDRLVQNFQVGLYKNIPIRLSVNAVNLLAVAGMSCLTVMLSALLPAVKMGKIGPVESIRGNVSGSGRQYPSRFGLLRRGGTETLLAVNGTGRLPHLTRGIVRSIAAFGVLTAVTLYGAQSVIRLVDARMGMNDFIYNVKGIDYALYSEASAVGLYQGAKARIASDSAVTQAKELIDYSFGCHITGDAFSDEYRRALEEIVRAYIPSDEKQVQEILRNNKENPQWLRLFCLDDEDFRKLAAAGDADLSIANDTDRPAVLLYRKVELSTQNYIVTSDKPDFHFVEVQNAFRCAVGEELPFTVDQNGEELRFTVAGYLDEAALSPYFITHSERPLAIINRSAAAMIDRALQGGEESSYCPDYLLMFGLKDGEGAALLRELSQIREQAPEESLYIITYDSINGEKGFYGAVESIIRILAYCFTALMTAVCLLNLYHSVKGRAMERRREIAMLRSMGMTGRQLRRMLTTENILMAAKGLLIAAALAAVFMLALNRAIVSRFGSITLPVPYGLIAGILAAVCIIMAVMTLVCYRFSEKQSIVEDIRNETV